MRLTIAFIYGLLITAGSAVTASAQQKFEKAEFYSVMKSGDVTAVETELTKLDDVTPIEKEGYTGALLMKKAGLLKKPKERLLFFKQGRIKLETALMADHYNIEFHFLRLAIEEHAPKIVRYHDDIEKDKALVIKNFKDLSREVQHAILDYCSNSKVLHKQDF